jgi:hypothetical protein
VKKVWLGWLSISWGIHLREEEQLKLQNKKKICFFFLCFVSEPRFQDGVAEDTGIHRMAVWKTIT